MFKWLARLFEKKPYPFEELTDQVLANTWGGDPVTAIVGSSLISAGVGAAASNSAARTQANAANRATDSQQQMFEQTRADQAPWRAAGGTSLSEIMKQFGLDEGGTGQGYFSHQFNADDLKNGLAPNYDFMKAQGQGAVGNMANAMGGLGGNSLTAIDKWTQDYASGAYQQAFANYNNQRSDIFNRLASIAGLGQTASSNAATGGSQYAQGIANSQIGAGNALAAGQVGVANAFNGGISSGMGWYGLNNLTGGRLFGGGGGDPALAGGPT